MSSTHSLSSTGSENNQNTEGKKVGVGHSHSTKHRVSDRSGHLKNAGEKKNTHGLLSAEGGMS